MYWMLSWTGNPPRLQTQLANVLDAILSDVLDAIVDWQSC
jgi:hypothetical protein